MKDRIFLIVLLIAFTIVTTISLSGNLRNKVKALFESNEREVLATIEGRIVDHSTFQKVIKVLDGQNIRIELYSIQNETPELMSELVLENRKDGFATVAGQATQLAVQDFDGDGIEEIIVPTFDQKMDPRLNVFKYNPETNTLENVTSSLNQ